MLCVHSDFFLWFCSQIVQNTNYIIEILDFTVSNPLFHYDIFVIHELIPLFEHDIQGQRLRKRSGKYVLHLCSPNCYSAAVNLFSPHACAHKAGVLELNPGK